MENTVEAVRNRFMELHYKPTGSEVFQKDCRVKDLSKIYSHMTTKQIVNALIQFSEYGEYEEGKNGT
jgi:hypothetical protein